VKAKPKDRDRNTTLPSVSLSREDLDQIVGMFSEVPIKPEWGDITISDKTHEYDTLQEVFENVGSKPKELQIRILYPSVKLELSRSIFGLSSLDYHSTFDEPEDHPGEVLYLRVLDLLNQRKTFAARVSGRMFSLLGVASFFVGWGFEGTLEKSVFGSLLFLGCVLWLFVGVVLWHARAGISFISLSPKGSKSTFWGRNKEWLIPTIAAVVGGTAVEVVRFAISRTAPK